MISSTLAAALLAALAAGGVAYALLYPRLSGEARAEKRQKALIGAGPERRIERVSATARRDQVAQSLKDIEAKQQKRSRLTLEMKLTQAGLTWTRTRFYLVSALCGAVCGVLLFALTGEPMAGAGAAFVGALGVPQWLLAFRKKKRVQRFTEELPNAIDVIVRGIRAGLPLGDCMRIVASEAQEPLRSEFRAIIESQAVGIPITEAVTKLYERIPVSEVNFFGIVIAIQQKAGGSLSEALGNLSRVLRDRRRMAGKISAMSMEAKASAAIIAILPFAVASMTYLSSPSYIELLWTTQMGKLALVVSAVWMLAGILVMRKMINFDF